LCYEISYFNRRRQGTCLGAFISDGKGIALCLWAAWQNTACRLKMVRMSVQSFAKRCKAEEKEEEEAKEEEAKEEEEVVEA